MAGINPPLERSAGRRIGTAAITAPRLVMSWEDWLTFCAATVAFLSVAVSIQQAHWVNNMPALVPTALMGLLVGMIAARIRFPAAGIHPFAIAIGVVVVVLAAQSYADGASLADRLGDFRIRMQEWWDVVRSGDISNDNLPFVTLVHSATFLAAYTAAWAIYRWHNAWVAVVPGGVILLANISFLKGQPSGAFVVFLFGAIVLIARLHLQKSQVEWRKRSVDYPEFISVSAIQLTLFLTTALLIAAWWLPLGNQAKAVEGAFDSISAPVRGHSDTLVRLFHNIDSRKGARLHSFGDTLPVQGQVKLGTKPILEVTRTDSRPGLLRATSYDDYTGNGWKATTRDTTRVDARDLAIDQSTGDYEARQVSVLKVKVLDSESALLTPGSPLAATINSIIDTPKGFAGDIERMRSRTAMENGDTYNAFGSESTATAEQLSSAGADYPDWVKQKYLQLPKSLPQRVRDEAARVVKDDKATNPYAEATSLEAYLRNFPYDLLVDSPPAGRDLVDFFLFDLKRGYFDYQATSMVVMLRTLGIPARITVGYALDPGSLGQTTYTVKKDNAYSWVEVFFPKYGWVNFNPTQDRPEGGASGITTGPDGNVEPFPDINDLFPPDSTDPIAGPLVDALNEPAVTHTSPPWTLIWSLSGALAALVALYFAGRFSWNWGLGSLEPRAQLWAKTQRLAGWAGLGSRPAETAREWSRRVGSAIDREPEAAGLAEAYEESRYGRPDLQRIDDDTALSAYQKVRGALVSKVLRRKPRPRT